MKLSWWWVAAIAVLAYHLGRNSAFKAVANAGGPDYTGRLPTSPLTKLVDALTPGAAVANVIVPPSPAAGAVNPPGFSAWNP